jgi:hypothetical protein
MGQHFPKLLSACGWFQVDSFFNFFSPPEVPNEDEEIEEEAMEDLQVMVEADYDVSGGRSAP